jgi:Fe-Mn family superoxide dismutase
MYEQEKLPYAFDALEPYIDARTMELHYTKHHAGYVSKLNKALEGREDLAEIDLEVLIADLNLVPEDIRQTIRDNGGGHLNHSLFWQVLSPKGGGKPEGELLHQIEGDFGSFESFQERLTKAALSRFGSGWAWLVLGPAGRLEVITTPNQDSPLMLGYRPILGFDVWEHAYYLNYQNRRAEYIEALWKLVDWRAVADIYSRSLEMLLRLSR